MKLFVKIKETKIIKKFKKEYQQLISTNKIYESIDLCINYLEIMTIKTNKELILSYKMYSYLAIDDFASFMAEKDKIIRNDFASLVKYYELLILLDEGSSNFDVVYKEFLEFKYKSNVALTPFLILKNEIDSIHNAIKNNELLDEKTINHIKKSNLPILKRLLEKTINGVSMQ